MVREKNVKVMTRLALYEKNQGKTEIPMTEYSKGDYVRLNILKSIVAATIAFLCIVALVAVYRAEYLLSHVMQIDYKNLGIRILAVYVIWILIYWVIARLFYSRKYEKARPKIIIYNHNLKKLLEITQKEEVKTAIPKGGVVIDDDFIDF